MYNLYLDDIRHPSMTYPHMKDGDWTVVKSYNSFVEIITQRGLPTMVSFDHDLADEHYDYRVKYSEYKEKTGMDCAKWLVNYCMDNNLKLPVWNVHSANPIGAANIYSYLSNFERIRDAQNIT